MILKNKIQVLINKKAFSHFAFWLIIFIFYVSAYWPLESNKSFLLEQMLIKTMVQVGLAYLLISFLVPFLIKGKQIILFAIYSLISIYLAYVIFTAFRCYYLVPQYPEVFKMRPPLIFYERITNIPAFLNNVTGLLFPTILLMVLDYFRHQKEILSLKEQKKSTELELLKNQLNPHFLFNTLNNLYALALKKSDKTPEVIARLSDILDHMLYRCKEKFVPLSDEIKLLENYIALEKVRYGNRLNINFNYYQHESINIAPLLLLTFLENAFKHGVSQEVNQATINLELIIKDGDILFKIENSKPAENESISKSDNIGLSNIKQQLSLIYGNQFKLNINETPAMFYVSLKLPTR